MKRLLWSLGLICLGAMPVSAQPAQVAACQDAPTAQCLIDIATAPGAKLADDRQWLLWRGGAAMTDIPKARAAFERVMRARGVKQKYIDEDAPREYGAVAVAALMAQGASFQQALAQMPEVTPDHYARVAYALPSGVERASTRPVPVKPLSDQDKQRMAEVTKALLLGLDEKPAAQALDDAKAAMHLSFALNDDALALEIWDKVKHLPSEVRNGWRRLGRPLIRQIGIENVLQAHEASEKTEPMFIAGLASITSDNALAADLLGRAFDALIGAGDFQDRREARVLGLITMEASRQGHTALARAQADRLLDAVLNLPYDDRRALDRAVIYAIVTAQPDPDKLAPLMIDLFHGLPTPAHGKVPGFVPQPGKLRDRPGQSGPDLSTYFALNGDVDTAMALFDDGFRPDLSAPQLLMLDLAYVALPRALILELMDRLGDLLDPAQMAMLRAQLLAKPTAWTRTAQDTQWARDTLREMLEAPLMTHEDAPRLYHELTVSAYALDRPQLAATARMRMAQSALATGSAEMMLRAAGNLHRHNPDRFNR